MNSEYVKVAEDNHQKFFTETSGVKTFCMVESNTAEDRSVCTKFKPAELYWSVIYAEFSYKLLPHSISVIVNSHTYYLNRQCEVFPTAALPRGDTMTHGET